MEEIVQLESVTEFNQMRDVTTVHPQITVLDLAKANPMPARTFNFGVYAVYLKEVKCGDLRYGRKNYDYQEGTLVFIALGRIIGAPPTFETNGWAAVFDPPLIKGTYLGNHIQDYPPQAYIQSKVIDIVKERIFDFGKSISEISYILGFRDSQHFTRLFKQKVGIAPNEYRKLN